MIRANPAGVSPLNERIAPCAFVSETCALTKSGDVFSVLELAGRDAEGLDREEIAQLTHRVEATCRPLGTEFVLYQYLVKLDSPELPITQGPDVHAERRAKWLQSRRSQLFSVKLYMVILRVRPTGGSSRHQGLKGFLNSFSVGNVLKLESDALKREVEQLGLAVQGMCVGLRDFSPAVLDRARTLGFLRQLVNYGAAALPEGRTVFNFHLDQSLAESALECWPHHLSQNGLFIKLLSLAELPAHTFPNLLRGLMNAPCNLIACSIWKRESNALVRRHIDTMRRHLNLQKVSLSSYLGNSEPRPHELLVDESANAGVEILNDVLVELETKDNFCGRFSLTMAVFNPELALVRQAAATVKDLFATYDGRVVEETYNQLNAWLSMVPGNHAHNLRQLWLLNTSYSDLSFVYAPSIGERVNAHLGEPALAIVETRERTPYFLNLHRQDLGHTFITGAPGSGKSFLTNFVTASYQVYEPYTLIFDQGHSYRKLTEHYAGTYVHVGKLSAFPINPFSLKPTPENIDFLFAFVRVLLENRSTPLTTEQRKDLHRAITDLYDLGADVRTLSTLSRICHRSYAPRLGEWVGQGRLAEYFDHVEDTLTLARFQTFDFEGMDQADVLEPWLFYVLHRASIRIHDPAENATAKLVVMDEAWRFFKNPVTAGYINEALKTWRKRNAVLVLATQSGADLTSSPLLSAVTENCATKLFLANPGMDREAYRKLFNLNMTQAELIAQLKPKQEFLLYREQEGSKVLSLLVDPESQSLFTHRGHTA